MSAIREAIELVEEVERLETINKELIKALRKIVGALNGDRLIRNEAIAIIIAKQALAKAKEE